MGEFGVALAGYGREAGRGDPKTIIALCVTSNVKAKTANDTLFDSLV